MENERLSSLYKKERISKIFGVVSFVGGIIALILSKGYSTEANGEIEAMRASNPEYQAMLRAREEQNRIEREKERADKQQRYLADSAAKEKELEAEKQRYILEQEKLKVDQENKRLSSIQAMNVEAMETLEEYTDLSNLDDYGLVDAAYKIMDILKKEGITEQVKYRGLAKISAFKDYTTSSDTDKKLDEIIHKIERL